MRRRAPVSFTDALVALRVRRSRGEMYIDHGRLCVCVPVCMCVYLPRRIPTLLHGSGCNFGNGSDCPIVVHYLAYLQSVLAGFVVTTT